MSAADGAALRDRAIADQQLTRAETIAAGVAVLADAAARGPFSVNDVRGRLRAAGVEPKLTGSVFAAASSARILRQIGSEPSTDAGTHGKRIAIYVAADSPTPDHRDLPARPATYADFLAAKRTRIPAAGIPCEPDDLPPELFGFQREAVARLVRMGRAALWADTGLGKTRMQLAWLDRMLAAAGGRGIILAPLAVAQQTIREARAMGIEVAYIRDAAESDALGARIAITNYDRLHQLRPADYTAVVLDESSVLKDVTTKTRDALVDAFAQTPYRLACSATPAPNDVTELANHAEFLSVATRRDMLAKFFVSDLQGNKRIKGHAEDALWDWIAQWAVAFRMPSDLGFPDDGFNLPPLDIRPVLLPVDMEMDGQLFPTGIGGVSGRAEVRRLTLADRVAAAVELVRAEPDEAWLLWCGLNDEADALAAALPGAVNVHGALSAEAKAAALLGFADGSIRTLITKPKIAGQGMNWQHCARMAFVGLGDSYEAYYQCIRRSWRYGQTRPVHVHVVLSELEGVIARNVAAKEAAVRGQQDALIARMRPAPEDRS